MTHALLDIAYGSGTMQFTQPTVEATSIPSKGFFEGDPLAPGVLAGAPNPAVSVLAAEQAVMTNHFLFDFYYQIWVIPGTLIAQNPQYDTPIPFFIWNAFPQPATNTLTAVNATDATGLTIEGIIDTTFDALEYRQMGVVITTDAPGSVDASFVFDFAEGDGLFRFIASIANILALRFEEGIHVDLDWLTDVLLRYNGREQRLALRQRPRRTFMADLVIGDDAERKALYDEIYKTATALLTIPLYQTMTPLRAATVIGDNKIYCNPKRADLRVGGYVLILKRNGAQVLSKVSGIFASYVTVESAHSEAVPVSGSKVMSAVTTRLPDMSGLSMGSVGGQASLTFMEYQAQDSLVHPLSTAALTLHYGAPVLERRPLAEKGDERFGTGLVTIDNETGRPTRYTGWDQKYVQGERVYLIQTLFEPADLDYWMVFLEHCRGMQRGFLASTYRHDQISVELTTLSIELEGLSYVQLYGDADTYRNLEIVTNLGTYWVQVETFTAGEDTSTLIFTDPISADLTGVEVERVSYLMRMRLGSDKVGITFNDTHALLTLTLKAISNDEVTL